jgi:hypothetical protein
VFIKENSFSPKTIGHLAVYHLLSWLDAVTPITVIHHAKPARTVWRILFNWQAHNLDSSNAHAIFACVGGTPERLTQEEEKVKTFCIV